jgi:hypothetical protein
MFCSDNPDFFIDADPSRNCNWVGRFQAWRRCAEQGATENCRATCDPNCTTPLPSFVPSSSPSIKPR